MTTKKKRNQIPIVESPDTSEEKMSLTPIETSTALMPQGKSPQSQSSSRTSQLSLDLENSPDFEVPKLPFQNKNSAKKSTSKSSEGGLDQKEKGKDSNPGVKIKTSKKPRIRKKRFSEIPLDSQNSDEEFDIFFLLMDTGSPVEDIVVDWIKKYTEDRENAFQILIQFFVNFCGSKARVTPEMIARMETTNIISRSFNEIEEKYVIKYPLIRGGNDWKNFRLNICDFINCLIHQCYKSKIIFDDYLLRHLIGFLIPLSESKVLIFRHTATFSAMKLSTTLVDVVVKICKKYSTNTEKYKSEMEKETDERSTEKLEFLLVQQQELEKNCKEIRSALANMFDSIFETRFRDSCSEIREICIEELGFWMQKLPQDFLVDERLKYIGWNLHDSSWRVRLKCVEALQPLYDSEDLYPELRKFNNKFKERILNMTHDERNDVAVETVKIVISILKHEPKLLSDTDNENVFELVFELYQPLARAAGEFSNKCSFMPNMEADGEITNSGDKKLQSNTNSIRDLVLFLVEANVPGHGDLLVDSLIETNKMMKDWECMTDLLLEEEEEDFDNQHQTALIELMFFSIKQTVTGEIPELRTPKPKITEKQENQMKKDKRKITKHFIETFPSLLSKYSADPEKLKYLLKIPQYFDLHILDNYEEYLQAILIQMQTIVEICFDSDVLDAVARTFEYLCTKDHPNFSRCDLARSSLIDKIIKKYNTSMQEYTATLEAGEENDENLFNVRESLKKIAIFYMSHDLNHWQIWDSLLSNLVDIFSTTGSQISFPDEAIYKYCITSCYFSLLWSQRHLIDWVDSDTRGKEKCEVLRERLDDFMNLMCNLILGEPIRKPVTVGLKEDAYLAFCDLLAIFCNQLQSHINPLMHQLTYTPTPLMINMMHNFLKQFVFVERIDQETFEHLSMEEFEKRRKFLASYCKLITYNMIPTKEAAVVFKYYVKYYEDFGEIIKLTLERAWEINKTNCALTMQYTLNLLFNEIVAQKRTIDRRSKEFLAIKELAREFSVFFESDFVENQKALIALHKAGIRFAFKELRGFKFNPKSPPINFLFFEILSEFMDTLMKDEKYVLLQFLNDHIEDGMLSIVTDYLVKYRNRLLLDDTNDETEEGNTTANPKVSRMSKKKKFPKKPELSISKVKLPRRSSIGDVSGIETNLRFSSDETSPIQSIEDSSPLPSPEESTTRGNLESSENTY